MEQNKTDFNDFSDNWIALNHMVREMHRQSLKRDWLKAYECAVSCKVLSEQLADFFDGMEQ